MSGYTMTQPELYYSLPANVTKNTYTAIAPISAPNPSGSVPRCVIPALYFSQIGKSMHFEANGTLECDSAASFTFTGGLDTTGGTLGSTLFATAALALSTAVTVFPWTMEFDVVAQAVGSSGTTLQVNGEVDLHVGASGVWGTPTSTRYTSMIANTLTSVDNEANLFLELFGTWTVSNVANTTTLQQFKVYLEN